MEKLSDDVLLLSYKNAKKMDDMDEKFIELLTKEIIKRDLPLEVDK